MAPVHERAVDFATATAPRSLLEPRGHRTSSMAGKSIKNKRKSASRKGGRKKHA
jgi:hypothetical protein